MPTSKFGTPSALKNFFLFGLETEEVRTLRERGYRPRDFCQNTPDLMEALTMLDEGAFSRGDRHLFAPLAGRILEHDEYMVCADFAAYGECREKAAATYMDSRQWTRMSILNTARMGRFSSDRSITEYCRDILACGSGPRWSCRGPDAGPHANRPGAPPSLNPMARSGIPAFPR